MKVLDFYADWCGPCQRLKPIMEELEAEHPEVEFSRVDIDAEPEKAEKYEVMSIPTLVFLDEDGSVSATLVGLSSKEEIEKYLQ